MTARFGAARAATGPDRLDRLTAGMLADVAVLTQDIFTVDVNQLPGTNAVLTIVNGRVVRDTLTVR